MSSSWERFRAALTGRHDEVAVAPLVAADHAAWISKLPISHVVRSADLLAQALTNAHNLYQGDFVNIFCDVYLEAEAMGCQLDFPGDASPYPVKTCAPESLKATVPQRDGRLPMMIQAAKLIAQELGSEVPVFASMKDPFSAAALACGAEDFLALLISQPFLARMAIEKAWQNQRRYLAALLETGVHIVIGAPMASGGILGSRHFRSFAAEPIRDLVEQIRSAGRIAGIHLCGDADPVLDQLAIMPAHFLSLESFNLDHWKGLVSDGQPHPAIMGYFPTTLLLQGDDRAIAAEAKLELTTLRGLAHILATACDVPQRCPSDKVQAFLRAARSWQFSFA